MSAELPLPNSGPVATGEPVLVQSAAPGKNLRWPWQLAQYGSVAALAFASYLLVSHFFLQSVSVVGISMVPTLRDTQRYLLNRWVFHVRAPRVTDIVVLRDPMDNGFSVKRVVALPGDQVLLKDGDVYVNGQKLSEPYLVRGTPTFMSAPLNQVSFRCGEQQYFVMGDNRTRSIDSRAYGPVPRGNILGLVIH